MPGISYAPSYWKMHQEVLVGLLLAPYAEAYQHMYYQPACSCAPGYVPSAT
jgi:hypothetical protein